MVSRVKYRWEIHWERGNKCALGLEYRGRPCPLPKQIETICHRLQLHLPNPVSLALLRYSLYNKNTSIDSVEFGDFFIEFTRLCHHHPICFRTFLTALLRCNSYIITFTHLKFIVQWFLEYSQICPAITSHFFNCSYHLKSVGI